MAPGALVLGGAWTIEAGALELGRFTLAKAKAPLPGKSVWGSTGYIASRGPGYILGPKAGPHTGWLDIHAPVEAAPLVVVGPGWT